MSDIKAVFFDVGSTLIDPNPDIDGVFYEVATERGHHISPEEVRVHLPAVFGFYEQEYLRDGDFWCSPEGAAGMYLDMYRYLGRLTGLERDAEGIAQEVHARFMGSRHWEVIEDVRPCLESLRREQLRMGVVSNWATNLDSLLCDLRMRPYFEDVVASAVVGYRKPDPQIFALALERMGIYPDEVIHVGDRPDADGIGAYEADIRPVIIDRQHRYKECGYMRIESLSELPALIHSL